MSCLRQEAFRNMLTNIVPLLAAGLQSMSSGYVQQGQKWGQQIQSELSQLSSYSPIQLEQYVEQYQQQYCTPASITPEMKMPGNYTGERVVSE